MGKTRGYDRQLKITDLIHLYRSPFSTERAFLFVNQLAYSLLQNIARSYHPYNYFHLHKLDIAFCDIKKPKENGKEKC